jgi:pilus assembly protein CpaF
MAAGMTARTTPDGLVDRVRERLAASDVAPSPGSVAAAVRNRASALAPVDVLRTSRALVDEFAGAGPLESLLREPDVTDVLVNGHAQVWVDRGRGLELADVRLADEQAVRRLAVRLVGAAGRRLDDAVPCADVRLADGVRLHAVLPPICGTGACLSFRVPRRRPFELDEWVGAGDMPRAVAAVLRGVVESRATFLVTGGTGTGKTTLLSTLLGLADHRERIVLIEDNAELRPDHPHVVRLLTRAANAEGAGEVGLGALVRESLRMRPDRIVVGEVRGAECADLLAALNVGHDGGAGTLHANSPGDVPARVEALCTAAGLMRDAAHSQLAAGLRVVVHLVREGPRHRRLGSVGLVVRRSDGLVDVQPALRLVGGDLVEADAAPLLAAVLADGP